jgi:hypothetical protein
MEFKKNQRGGGESKIFCKHIGKCYNVPTWYNYYTLIKKTKGVKTDFKK